MATESMTSRQVAVCLLAWLERREWRIFLDKKGRMSTIIGDDTPNMPQAVILALLGSLESDVVAVLRGLNHVH